MEGMELICFQIISFAGSAKANLMQALQCTKQGNTEEAQKLLQEASDTFIQAHEVHAQLIQEEANGNSVLMSLLLTHAEDQLMGAELTKDVVLEFIDLFENYTLVKK